MKNDETGLLFRQAYQKPKILCIFAENKSGMETITLRYEAGSAFANALAAFLANNEGYNVMDKKTTAKRQHKTNYELTLEACKDADEGKGTLFTDFDDFKRHIHAL